MIFWHLFSVRLGIMTGSVKPLWSTIRSGFSVWISLNLALIISGAVVVGFLPVIAKGWLLYSSFFGCTLVFDTEMQNQFGLIVKRNICWMKQRERERERKRAREREMGKHVSYNYGILMHIVRCCTF